MAVVSSGELGNPVRTGHQTLAGIQAATDSGMEDEDFTCIHLWMDSLAGKQRRKRSFRLL